MAGRIRSLRPEILDDEVLASLSSDAWRIAISILLLADDFGNVRFGDRYLAANVFQDTSRDVASAVDELIARNVVTPYAVDGQRYATIRGWADEHGRFRQRLDNASKTTRVPGPEKDDGTWSRDVATHPAASRGDSPRPAAVRGSRARAPDHDHDPDPKHEHDRQAQAPAAIAAAGATAPAPPSELQLIPAEPETKRGGPAERIFDAYKAARRNWNPKTRVEALVLSTKARKAITARMREGHTEPTLTLAATGIFLDPWDGRANHIELEIAMRSENVPKFAAFAAEAAEAIRARQPTTEQHGPPAPVTPELAAMLAAALKPSAPTPLFRGGAPESPSRRNLHDPRLLAASGLGPRKPKTPAVMQDDPPETPEQQAERLAYLEAHPIDAALRAAGGGK